MPFDPRSSGHFHFYGFLFAAVKRKDSCRDNNRRHRGRIMLLPGGAQLRPELGGGSFLAFATAIARNSRTVKKRSVVGLLSALFFIALPHASEYNPIQP